VADHHRRGYARQSRLAARKHGAGSEPARAIWPGIFGGRYRPLDSEDVEQIHQTVVQILESVGLQGASKKCIDVIVKAGGRVTQDGRLQIPEPLLDKALELAGRGFHLHALDPVHDINPSATRIHLGTSGAAVSVVDSDTRNLRPSVLSDLYDMARLANVLANIHMFQRVCVPCDIEDPREMDINTLFACLAGTSKHIGTSFVNETHMHEGIEMMHMVSGGAKNWIDRPFMCVSTCFIVPPLTFAEEALGVIECAARTGTPLKLVSAGQAGATSPAPLAGAIALQSAEVLSGLVYVNLLNPGHPALFGALPFVSDLRTGSMSGGSAEQGLLMAGCAQMAQYYRLPCAVSAGMTDSKLPDFQAGYEKGCTELLSALAGANLIYEAAGMYGSLLACSPESFVLDNDLIGCVLRATRGIEVSPETLSIDAIRDVCLHGPGHFLGHSQTLSRMQSDYYYPQLADRVTPLEWQEKEGPELLELARSRTREILAQPHPDHLSGDLEQAIRKRFPIRLKNRSHAPQAPA